MCQETKHRICLDVFGQPDLPADPSCLAGLVSLKVLAVPGERIFGQCSKLTYQTNSLFSTPEVFYSHICQNHQLIFLRGYRLNGSALCQKKVILFPSEVIQSPGDKS